MTEADKVKLTIKIAEELNKTAQVKGYKIGNLQEIRREIGIVSRQRPERIFDIQQIIEINQPWAAHDGSRRNAEPQFNIAAHDDVRYGLAFALQASETLKDPIISLLPKIRLFNKHVYSIAFEPCMKMHCGAHELTMPHEIPDEWIRDGNFIFLGEYVNPSDFDVDRALAVFDQLLPLYRKIEEDSPR